MASLQVPTLFLRKPRFKESLQVRQAVDGSQEDTPTNPPQLPPGTASRLAGLFANRRCRSRIIAWRSIISISITYAKCYPLFSGVAFCITY